jgi:UDPglucose 6-dehydrogenase
MEQAERVLPAIEYAARAQQVAEGADALVIVTEWEEFRGLDLDRIAKTMRGRVLVDLRNVYERDEAERAGMTYFAIGRPAGSSAPLRVAAE